MHSSVPTHSHDLFAVSLVQEQQHYRLQPGRAGFGVSGHENVAALTLPVFAQHVEALLKKMEEEKMTKKREGLFVIRKRVNKAKVCVEVGIREVEQINRARLRFYFSSQKLLQQWKYAIDHLSNERVVHQPMHSFVSVAVSSR